MTALSAIDRLLRDRPIPCAIDGSVDGANPSIVRDTDIRRSEL